MSDATASYAGLRGKVAVVTGGSGALGGAACRALAAQGVAVAVSGRNAERLERVVAEIRGAGGTAIAVAADVTDPAALERLRAAAAEQLGRIDFVAAFAGGGGEPAPLAELTLERWHQTLDSNLTSAFLTLKTFLPGMAERGHGAVVTISSLAGQHVIPQAQTAASPAYAAAKAGLLLLTRQAAREYAPRGVRINAISPGSVTNERIAAQPEQVREGMRRSQPLGRIGEPDDVAGALLYLLSDAAAWITGATLDVNGGFAML